MNRNSIFFIILLMCIAGRGHAQENIIHGASPNLHLEHKVTSGESWYSISRSYNLNAKALAAYNNSPATKPLEIGTVLNIPLTAANFSQNNEKMPGEELVPLYHVVQEKEWLYRISMNHNKVPVASIEKWNSITKDQAKAGMKLIVGFLKAKEGDAIAAKKSAVPDDKKLEVKKEQTENKPVIKTQPEEKRTDAADEIKQVSNQKGSGYFKSLYGNNGKNSSGVSGIFKSTSGWYDGKYYALMNNVPVGTIVQVTNPQTSRSVYAKVLGELPEMKESAGLALRISDAAAKELGVEESKFSVDVKY